MNDDIRLFYKNWEQEVCELYFIESYSQYIVDTEIQEWLAGGNKQ